MDTVRDVVQTAADCLRQGDVARAEAICIAALRGAPGNSSLLHQLAIAARQRGDLPKAIAWLEQAVGSAPTSTMLRNNLAVLLEQSGRHAEALVHYEAAVRLDPDKPAIQFNRANTLNALERHADAIDGYRKTLQLDPNHVGALHNFGVALSELGSHAQAEQFLRKVIELNPQNGDAQVNLGSVLQKLGHPSEALSCFRRAAELDPNSPEAAAGEAAILDQMGDVTAATERLAPFLATRHVDVVTAFATIARPLGREAEAVAALREVLETNLPPLKRRAAYFALGHLLDAVAEFEDAFRAFQLGHESAPLSFDAEHFARAVDGIISVFSAEFLRCAPQGSNSSELPVFVVGMPRSGTTLVEQILASHPLVFGAGELPDIERLAFNPPALNTPNYPYSMRAHTGESLDRLADAYLSVLSRLQDGATRVVDKMPGNFMHLGFIGRLFPRARVIHIRRDPLDTCLSCYFQNFNQGHEFADDLSQLGFVYRQYARIMAHWEEVAPIAILHLDYEELVQNQELETRRLLEYCELPWDERCLRFHESRRTVQTASYAQVRQPLYLKSIGRHRHYAAHLGTLRQALESAGDR